MMAIWKITPALGAGNTIVLKPAETTPGSAVLLARIAAEVLPPGVLNVVCGDKDTGRALVEHPVPRPVALTGSLRAGRQIAAGAAADVKRLHLELGGNAPVIVHDDVDPVATAEALAAVGFYNAGQDCTAPSRILVQCNVHDRFAEALATAAAQTRTRGPGRALRGVRPDPPQARDEPTWRHPRGHRSCRLAGLSFRSVPVAAIRGALRGDSAGRSFGRRQNTWRAAKATKSDRPDDRPGAHDEPRSVPRLRPRRRRRRRQRARRD